MTTDMAWCRGPGPGKTIAAAREIERSTSKMGKYEINWERVIYFFIEGKWKEAQADVRRKKRNNWKGQPQPG